MMGECVKVKGWYVKVMRWCLKVKGGCEGEGMHGV